MSHQAVLSSQVYRTHINPLIPQKRLQTQEETPRQQGDTTCIIIIIIIMIVIIIIIIIIIIVISVFHVYYHPVFSESLLGFGVSSGEFRDIV